ncbi:MAG: hypothetical protein RMN51_10295 [Verrucomicrobiota bacterium]|nr:hypothetical protein [Limisphaera sp.]MDW8382476.1 hypothetical protein [Verrucomicrobiota bacterium]
MHRTNQLGYRDWPVVAWLALPMWLSGSSLGVGQCPSIMPEAVFVSASRGKVGFVCGDCPKRYFLAQLYGYSGAFDNHGHGVYRGSFATVQSAGYTSTGGSFVDPQKLPDGTIRTRLPEHDGCIPGFTTNFSGWMQFYYYSWYYDSYESSYRCIETANGSDPPGCILGVNLNCNEWLGDFSYWDNCVSSNAVYNPSHPCNTAVANVITCWSSWYIDEHFHAHGRASCYESHDGLYLGEYTTEALVTLVSSLLRERQPADFGQGASSVTPFANNNLSADESCASAVGCRWRARISGTIQGERYKIRYTRVEQQIVAGQRRSSRQRVEMVMEAPGPEWWFPSESGEWLAVEAWPAANCTTGCAGHASIMLVDFAIEPAEEAAPPGAGGPGGCEAGGPEDALDGRGLTREWGCADCGAGASDAMVNPCLHLSMGVAQGGGSAGSFWAGESSTGGLADVFNLSFGGQHGQGGVQVLYVTNQQNRGGRIVSRERLN